MNTQNLISETVDLEEAILALDHTVLNETLPQIQSSEDVAKTLVQENTGAPMQYIDALVHQQIDPSYQ